MCCRLNYLRCSRWGMRPQARTRRGDVALLQRAAEAQRHFRLWTPRRFSSQRTCPGSRTCQSVPFVPSALSGPCRSWTLTGGDPSVATSTRSPWAGAAAVCLFGCTPPTASLVPSLSIPLRNPSLVLLTDPAAQCQLQPNRAPNYYPDRAAGQHPDPASHLSPQARSAPSLCSLCAP